jgi:hypothetical protein
MSQYHVKVGGDNDTAIALNKIDVVVREIAAKHHFKVSEESSNYFAASAERSYRIGDKRCHVVVSVVDTAVVVKFILFQSGGWSCSPRHRRFQKEIEPSLRSVFQNYYIESTD